VTDDATLATPGWAFLASGVLEVGGEDLALHVRGPHTSGRVIYDLVRAVRDLAARHGSRLVVNDRVDVAMAAGVVDAHLGRRSLSIADAVRVMGPDARIGVSCHDRGAAVAARKGGARYLFAGPAYETASHPGAAGRGVAWLASMVESGGSWPSVAWTRTAWPSSGRRAAPGSPSYGGSGVPGIPLGPWWSTFRS
jgi:thiamine-phosphate diphosphorylase